MRLSVAIGCMLLGSAAVVCGQGADARFGDILKESLEILEKMTMQLAPVKDEESAKASRDELKKSVARWQDMRKRAEKIKPPASKEEKDRLEKEYRGKLTTANKKLLDEMERVKRVPGGRDALKELVALMKKKPK